MKPRIELAPEVKEQLKSVLKQYFKEKRDEELGDLAARLLLDFITKEIAPVYYNQGIRDSIAFMEDRIEDLYGLEI